MMFHHHRKSHELLAQSHQAEEFFWQDSVYQNNFLLFVEFAISQKMNPSEVHQIWLELPNRPMKTKQNYGDCHFLKDNHYSLLQICLLWFTYSTSI